MPVSRRLTLGILVGLALVYVILGWQYAVKTPAWQVPDEPAHYNYIRQIVEEGHLPTLKQGDWDSDYQNQLTASGFNPQYTAELDRIEYEDHQPLLYYLLASMPYGLSGGDLTTLRLFSVLLGLGLLVVTFLVIDTLFPEQPWLALTAAGLLAFIPQHLAMYGGVNNDSLAELLVALIFWQLVRYLQADQPTLGQALSLGGLVGLAFLTKSTIYFVAGVVGLAILLKWWRLGWSFQLGTQQLGAFLVPALLLGCLWWGRNLVVYGGTDFLGLQRHDQVAAGQLQTADYINVNLQGDKGLYRQNMLDTTYHSFWGQFGWMAAPMETRIYHLLFVLSVGMLVGSGLYAWRANWTPPQKEMLALFALSLVLVLVAYLFYNRQFVQFQGRYLYPALIPLALWGACGLVGWTRLFTRWIPPMRWASLIVVVFLALLAWYALNTYLVPNFQPRELPALESGS